MKIDYDPSGLTLARSEGTQGVRGNQAPRKLSAAEERQVAEAKKAAQEFEAMFAENMIKSMRQTSMPEDSSNAMDVFQGMLDSEYAKAMTSNGELGVQKLVLDWMKQTDPKLAAALGEAPVPQAGGFKDPGAVNNALKNFRLQQYQMQAAMPMAGSSFE